MSIRRYVSAVIAALSLAACVGAQAARPTIVATARPVPDVVNTAVRVLAIHGLSTARVDEQAGVVTSEWQATQFMYGSGPTNRTAYIVRRFTVIVAPTSDGSEVRVSVEDMACEEPGLVSDRDSGSHDGCSAVEGVVPPDQQKLDAIGVDLDRALRSA